MRGCLQLPSLRIKLNWSFVKWQEVHQTNRHALLLRRFRNQDNLPVVADNVTVVRDLRCSNQGAPVKQPGV